MAVIISAILIGLASWGISSQLPALPWYVPFIISFIAGMLLSNTRSNAFLAGFLGVGVFWCLASLLPHLQNDGILTDKIALMFTSETGTHVTSLILLIVVPVFGGLLGGAMAYSGKIIAMPGQRHNKHSKMHRKNRRRSSYKLKLN